MLRCTVTLPHANVPAMNDFMRRYARVEPDFHSIRLADMQDTVLYTIEHDEDAPLDCIQIIHCLQQLKDRSFLTSSSLLVPQLGYQPRKVGNAHAENS
jgi:hypothetical protein